MASNFYMRPRAFAPPSLPQPLSANSLIIPNDAYAASTSYLLDPLKRKGLLLRRVTGCPLVI